MNDLEIRYLDADNGECFMTLLAVSDRARIDRP